MAARGTVGTARGGGGRRRTAVGTERAFIELAVCGGVGDSRVAIIGSPPSHTAPQKIPFPSEPRRSKRRQGILRVFPI